MTAGRARPSLVRLASVVVCSALCIAAACSGGSEGGGDSVTNPKSSAPVANVVVTIRTPTIAVGGNVTATASLSTADGTMLTGRTVTWAVTDTMIARVDASGIVTALRPGQVSVTATAESVSGARGVTVVPGPVASITVTLTPAGPVLVGDTARASAAAKDSAGNVVTGQSVVWTVMPAQLASITPDGKISALVTGVGKIRATSSGASAVVGEADLTVRFPVVASVSVSIPNGTVQLGRIFQPSVVAKDSAGNVITGRKVTWSTSDTTVATIVSSELGIMYGASPGTAVIRAVVDGVAGQASVVVDARMPWRVRVASIQTGYGSPAGEIVPDSIAPRILVQDADNAGVPGLSVDYVVAATGGSIAVSSGKTDGTGYGTATGWRLSPILGQDNRLTVTVRNGSVVLGTFVFTFRGVGGSPASLRVLRGSGLFARPGRPTVTIPVVIALDRAGNPASGVVHFAVTGGGNIMAVDGDLSLPGSLGTASPGVWTMGSSPGVNTLVATTGTLSAVISVTATSQLATPFDMALRYDASLSAGAKEVFNDAVFRWRQIITAPLSSYHILAPSGACYSGSPAVDTVTTGTVVMVRIASTPGAAATTGICQVRPDGLPALAEITLDADGIGVAGNPEDYSYVITHELGHALGLIPDGPGLITGPSGNERFTGATAVAELVKIGGTSYGSGVPLSADNVHWRTSVIPADALSPGTTSWLWYVSTVTVGALKDLGYAVDMTKGDGFVIAPAQSASSLIPNGSRQIPRNSTSTRVHQIPIGNDVHIRRK